MWLTWTDSSVVYTLFMLSEAAAAEAAPIVLSVTAERLIVAVFPSLEVGGETGGGGGGAVSSSPAPFNAEHSENLELTIT